MALTTAQQVRLKIQDQPLIADDVYTFDGMSTGFTLPHRNLTTASAYVLDAGGQWSATGAAFDASGFVAFNTALASATGFKVHYTHSTFSDDEVDTMLTAGGGSINGAALQAIEDLMFDGLKRSIWRAPDGTEYDDTKAMALLNQMYDKFKQEELEDGILSGGLASWSENQADYS